MFINKPVGELSVLVIAGTFLLVLAVLMSDMWPHGLKLAVWNTVWHSAVIGVSNETFRILPCRCWFLLGRSELR